MSIPHSACLLTTSATLRRKVAAYLSASYGWPLTFAFITSSSSGGRARLPQCVVSMRCVLCFMSVILSDWRITDSFQICFRHPLPFIHHTQNISPKFGDLFFAVAAADEFECNIECLAGVVRALNSAAAVEIGGDADVISSMPAGIFPERTRKDRHG